MSHKESGGKDEASLADRGADNDSEARLLGSMCSGPELGERGPHGVDTGCLVKQGSGKVWGELKIRTRRVSTGRVSPRIGRDVY